MEIRHRWSLAAVVVVPVLAAVVVGALAMRPDAEPARTSPAVVDLTATDAMAVASVDDLVDAAACVLVGEVVHTERGRVIAADLVSRLVQIRVDEALVGDCPVGTVVLEEEGWLEDGTEVSVNRWPATAEGDIGVWFLVPGSSDELPYASTVATTGAVRWRGGESLVPGTAPGWLLDAVAEGREALADQVRSTSSDPG